jgi:hypothetical protein
MPRAERHSDRDPFASTYFVTVTRRVCVTRRFLMGLFSFLFGRGDGGRDGSSHEKAIVVGSVSEEYEWIQRNCPGFRPGIQALQEIEGKHYDVHTLRNAVGEERTVYFDISRFFGKF